MQWDEILPLKVMMVCLAPVITQGLDPDSSPPEGERVSFFW